MTFDWANLLAGGVVGFVMGVAANIAYGQHITRRAKAELKRKHENIVGTYTAYQFIDNSDNINYQEPIGTCRINYVKENILRLHYTEIRHPNEWEAVVWMENPFYGSMAWRYIKLQGKQPPQEHRYGFKRCIFSDGTSRDGKARKYFYLEGEKPYGKEVLEKD